jgi:hypothetical protein
MRVKKRIDEPILMQFNKIETINRLNVYMYLLAYGKFVLD